MTFTSDILLWLRMDVVGVGFKRNLNKITSSLCKKYQSINGGRTNERTIMMLWSELVSLVCGIVCVCVCTCI